MIIFVFGVIIGGALGMILMGLLCDADEPMKMEYEEDEDDRRDF